MIISQIFVNLLNFAITNAINIHYKRLVISFRKYLEFFKDVNYLNKYYYRALKSRLPINKLINVIERKIITSSWYEKIFYQ